MFKHVYKHTKELRDFDSNEYDAAGITEAAQEKISKRKNKGKKQPKVIQEEDLYEDVQMHDCRVCDEDNIEDLEEHVGKSYHRENVSKFKIRYKQFIRMARALIIKNKLPRGKGLKKQRYFKALYNYE